MFFICLACDILQEQYELVYSAVLELFKRHMDIIGDEHSGREVMLKLHIIFSYVFGQSISDYLLGLCMVTPKLECQDFIGLCQNLL